MHMTGQSSVEHSKNESLNKVLEYVPGGNSSAFLLVKSQLENEVKIYKEKVYMLEQKVNDHDFKMKQKT
jgi:hypothetical protein